MKKKGTILTQGTFDQEVEDAINNFINNPPNIEVYSNLENDNIYIVHGHDESARTELENILLKWGLKPKATIDQPSGGGTIIETLIRDLKTCNYGIVLFTPDDYGYSKKESSSNAQPRARQNVILELGILIAELGREKVMILKKENVEIPSDVNGVIYKGYKNSLKEIKHDIRDELVAAKIKIKNN